MDCNLVGPLDFQLSSNYFTCYDILSLVQVISRKVIKHYNLAMHPMDDEAFGSLQGLLQTLCKLVATYDFELGWNLHTCLIM